MFKHFLLLAFSLSLPLQAQTGSLPSFGICKPATERHTDVGCWILADEPQGKIDQAQTYWHIDAYRTRADAERARGAHATVVEAFGKVWLLTVAKRGWRPSPAGNHVEDVGPLPVKAGEQYSALFMEAVLTPGMTSAIHVHSGPEAWHTIAGETCLETPSGKVVGRAGAPGIVIPGGPPMLLTATGNETRRALVLILHASSQAPTSVVSDWSPKGLCSAAATQH